MLGGTEGLKGQLRSKYSTRPCAAEATQEQRLVDPTGTDTSNITAAGPETKEGPWIFLYMRKHETLFCETSL